MYTANEKRYDNTKYNYVGNSGLRLPIISVGLWQNFGINDDYDTMKDIILTAFDHGVTHFDLANNYGPEPGRAEINFGKILKENLMPYRDELIISTKAGYEMWPGPYGGIGGSRKYLTASLNQSLKRMDLDYVDIFYHHCLDPNTPHEETALCMSDIVRQGKALYIGMSNYDGNNMADMEKYCKTYNVPFIINQNRYSIFDRTIEDNGLKETASKSKKGIIAFSPLAQGQLSDKYANGIPQGARLYGKAGLQKHVGYTDNRPTQIKQLYDMAKDRGQTLSQMAIQWIMKDDDITSVLVGVHSKEQLLENLSAFENASPLTDEEIAKINSITKATE
ncbi:MAG: aldo/keto reductase [Clostridiales bacterium]|nr:aldo/keto reductase [Clostridiales bacterium]